MVKMVILSNLVLSTQPVDNFVNKFAKAAFFHAESTTD